MSYLPLTGSEEYRFYEIQQKWLVFEPMTDSEFAIKDKLFDVPMGQQERPVFNVDAPYDSGSNQITIQKIIHRFEDETDASEFITSLGENNYQAIIKKIENGVLVTEVHVVNLPLLEISCSFDYLNTKNGYFAKVYVSGTQFGNVVRLTQIDDNQTTKVNDSLVLDGYLKHFLIKDAQS